MNPTYELWVKPADGSGDWRLVQEDRSTMSSARTRRARSANAATVPLVKPYKWPVQAI